MFQLVKNCFTKKFFQIEGRSGRKEYIAFFLFEAIVSFILSSIVECTEGLYQTSAVVLFNIFGLVITIPNTTLSARRLHDLNLSGFWLILLAIIHIISRYIIWVVGLEDGILLLFEISYITSVVLPFMVLKGTKSTNRFGNELE